MATILTGFGTELWKDLTGYGTHTIYKPFKTLFGMWNPFTFVTYNEQNLGIQITQLKVKK